MIAFFMVACFVSDVELNDALDRDGDGFLPIQAGGDEAGQRAEQAGSTSQRHENAQGPLLGEDEHDSACGWSRPEPRMIWNRGLVTSARRVTAVVGGGRL